jgi:hypothetical protein
MRWIVGVGPLGQRKVRIAVPGCSRFSCDQLPPPQTAMTKALKTVAISLVKLIIYNFMQ